MKPRLCCWLGLAALASFPALLSGQPLSAGPPVLLVELPASIIKGVPSQLTWSPDSTTLCVQTLEGDTAPLKTRYYVIGPEQGANKGVVKGVDAAPGWAPAYWNWKSARTAPGHPELAIQVDTLTKAGGLPMQSLGDKAANRGIDNAIAARGNTEGSVVRTLTLKGVAIGQYIDQPLVPGTTFGWAPEALHAVAYTKLDGRLALMDLEGNKRDVETVKGILLPAWSPDGSRIVYLQKKGRHDYQLMEVPVVRP